MLTPTAQIEIPAQVRNPLVLTDQERREAHTDIVINSMPSGTFFIMNLLAAVIAGYGLLQNSPAVVIGAMLVAMMLGPIVGLGLAVLQNDRLLLARALGGVALGTVWVVGIGLVIGLLHHQHVLTDEIIGRTAPNVMDLMIALAGGLAGALATISARLPVAVVGVGVATALVPPLVTCGILLSRGQWALAGGAFLLTLTNMVAIQFASSLVLWLAGFRRGQNQDGAHVHFLRANWWSLLLLAVLSVTLTLNLTRAATQQRLDIDVNTILTQHLNHGNNRLIQSRLLLKDRSDTRPAGAITVMAYVQGDIPPSQSEVDAA
ncbi:DUF389 domain-containing protein [Ottowia sp.]|uniref:DUF389 domain-containing protein n=1 Tax=Ottowia sp. TaxID=1898956 RepID=UPI003A8BCE51